MSDLRENLGSVIAWKWGKPFTARGETVEIEGVGEVDSATLEAAYQEWLERPAELPTKDEMVDEFLSNPVTKALVNAINDGSLPVAQGLALSEIKQKIKAKMA